MNSSYGWSRCIRWQSVMLRFRWSLFDAGVSVGLRLMMVGQGITGCSGTLTTVRDTALVGSDRRYVFGDQVLDFGAETLAKTKRQSLPGDLAFKINGALVLALRRWAIMVLMKLAGLI